MQETSEDGEWEDEHQNDKKEEDNYDPWAAWKGERSCVCTLM